MIRALVRGLGPAAREDLEAIPGVSAHDTETWGVAEVRASDDLEGMLSRRLGVRFLRDLPRVAATGEQWPEKFYPWQREGAALLARGEKRALIWSCGIMKTATALAAAEARSARRVLVVTRAAGRIVWPRDAAWAAPGRKIALVLGSGRDTPATRAARRRADKALTRFRVRGANVVVAASAREALDEGAWGVVVGWETLKHHADALRGVPWDVRIWDEAHMASGYRSQCTRAAHAVSRLGRKRAVDWLLTATLIPNDWSDLWGPLAIMAREAWGAGSFRFVHRYCDAKPERFALRALDTTGRSNVEELVERLGYWCDVRDRELLRGQLPEKTRNVVLVPPEAQRVTRAARRCRGYEAAIEYAESAKRDAVLDRVREALEGGEKVVLIGGRKAWVKHTLGLVERVVTTATKRELWLRATTGDDSVTDRAVLADEFVREAKGPACLIATMDSVKTSIDLNDADRMVVSFLPRTPEELIQLEGRVHRGGQLRPVAVDHFVAEGTVDDVIYENLLARLEGVGMAGMETEAVADMARGALSEAEMDARMAEWLAREGESVARATWDGESEEGAA